MRCLTASEVRPRTVVLGVEPSLGSLTGLVTEHAAKTRQPHLALELRHGGGRCRGHLLLLEALEGTTASFGERDGSDSNQPSPGPRASIVITACGPICAAEVNQPPGGLSTRRGMVDSASDEEE